MDQFEKVHLGAWIDYDKGLTRGWTLTLTSRQGFMLLALIAIVTQLTGQRSWKIIRFIIHQSREHDHPRPSMVKEQEIAIRVAETDLGTFQQMIALLWDWRHLGHPLVNAISQRRLQKSRRSTWIILCLSLLHFLGFLCLAVAIPALLGTVENPPVAISTGDCAEYDYDPWSSNQTALTSISEYRGRSESYALNYYKNCYQQTPNMDCHSLVRQSLDFTESKAECPFDQSICLPGIEPIRFDTGLIRLRDLGVNSRSGNRLSIRKRLTCSPIDISPFHVYTGDGPEVLFNFSSKDFFDLPQPVHNWLAFFPLFGSAYHTPEYVVKVMSAEGMGETYGATFDHRLHRLDGKVSLFLIEKAGIGFANPVSGPIFETASDTREINVPGRNSTLRAYYARDRFSAIACVEQAQIYNHKNGASTPPLGLNFGSAIYRDALALDADQTLATTFLTFQLPWSSVSRIEYLPTNERLDARSASNIPGLQLSLPPDQWVRECRRWFGISLAALQVKSLSSALGPLFPQDTSSFENKLDNPQLKSLKDFYCHHLKIVSPHHVRVNLFGLFCYTLITMTIWAISFADELTGRFMFRRWPRKVLAWRLDSSQGLIRHIQGGMFTESIGIPTVFRETNNELTAKHWCGGASPAMISLNHLSKELSREYRDQLIGIGWETKMKTLLIGAPSKVKGYFVRITPAIQAFSCTTARHVALNFQVIGHWVLTQINRFPGRRGHLSLVDAPSDWALLEMNMDSEDDE